VLRRKGDLSATQGRVVLMEYSEEYPLLMMNTGMGTRIFNYYRQRNPTDNPDLRCDDGDTVRLEPGDESPFQLGDVRPGQSVSAIDNNMFRAPLGQHNAAPTDFLVIRKGGKTWLRAINKVYTVGQQQPKMEVFAPNSKAHLMYQKNRMQAFIYRLFLKRHAVNQRLRIQDIMMLFPGNTEATIRKRLKDCADFQRGGDEYGWWTVKDQSLLHSEEELRQMLPPESVCVHDSMVHGQ